MTQLLSSDVRAILTLCGMCFFPAGCASEDGEEHDAPSTSSAPSVTSPATQTQESPSASTTEGASGMNCFGVADSVLVSELDATQLEAACRAYRRCSMITLTNDTACRLHAAVQAVSTAPEGATTEQLQSACAQAHDECSANPEPIVQQYQQGEQQLAQAPCGMPTDCSASFGQLAECAAGYASASLLAYPACSELTTSTELGRSPEPEACAALPGDCTDFLVLPAQ